MSASSRSGTAFIMSNVDNKMPQADKLAGSTAKLFLGMQLQCAECHVHPNVLHLFQLTKIDALLTIDTNEQASLDAFSRSEEAHAPGGLAKLLKRIGLG